MIFALLFLLFFFFMMSSRLFFISLVSLLLPLTGCVETKAPTAYTACATELSKTTVSTQVEKPAPIACAYGVPKLRPDFHHAPKISESGIFQIQYVDEATLAGAPKNLPSFDARLHIKGDSMNLGLSTNKVSVWRINMTPNTIQESRHPLLDSHLSAKSLIRDLTFMYWPTKSLNLMVSTMCQDCKVEERGQRRTLVRGNYTLLEMTLHDNTMTLRNYPEGYSLTFQTTAPKSSS